MAYTMDSTLGEVLKDPRAKAVLDQYVPGVSSNPQVAMVAGMTFKQIASFPMAASMGITEDKIKLIVAELNKI